MRGGLPEPIRRRLDPTARFGLRATLFGTAIVLVAVPFSYLLFEVLRQGPLTGLDERAAEWFHRRVVGHPSAIAWVRWVSLLGKPLWLGIAVTAGAVYAWRRGRVRLALYLVVAAALGGVVDTAVKVAVNRPRPELADPLANAFGKSFPSGHAMSSTVTYGALLLVFLPALPRRWRPLAVAGVFLLVFAIGLTRLLLGVHFVSDVLAGYALGLAWLAGVTAAFSIWRTEEGRRPVHITEGLEPEAAEQLAPGHDHSG